MKHSIWRRIGVLIALVSLSPAQAENAALLELLKALRANGTIDQRTYDAVLAAAQANEQSRPKAETPPATAEKAVPEAATDQPKINTRGRLEIASPDGDFKFRVGGRLHVDGAFHDGDIADHGDDFEFRRARLLLQGTLWRYWDYKLDYDFTTSGARGIADAYLAYTGFSPLIL
jgi:phosphate-selective porin OprO/OprP